MTECRLSCSIRTFGTQLTTRDDGTYENSAMANSTKYATLASNGRAVLSECMMV